MKKLSIALLCYLCSMVCYAAKPSVLISTCAFDNPAGKAYVEIFLNTAANSVATIKRTDGKYQGAIQVQLILKKDNAIVYADKYNLNSPMSEQAILTSDFADIQRISIDNGSYHLEVKVTDNNSPGAEPFIHQQDLLIDFPSDHVSISDIELLESYSKSAGVSRFSKNGIEMIPNISNFYPPSLSSIKFYAEVYNAGATLGADSNFIIRYRIDGYESKKNIENLGGVMKVKAKDVNVLLSEISIENLQSGNYNLVVEAVDKKNVVLASKKIFIQRANRILLPLLTGDVSKINTEGTFVEKITSLDTLREFIRCLYPISSNNEQLSAEAQVKLSEQQSMQQYILFFWLNRDRLNPEAAWNEYKALVDVVNANYKTFNKKGYESDRGRVYLQYGPPNTIANGDEPATLPYEIWHYYTLNTQRNRKFVFLNRNRASNDFVLIHSDANGEINQPRWPEMLADQHPGFDPRDTDKESGIAPYGNKSRDLYERPK